MNVRAGDRRGESSEMARRVAGFNWGATLAGPASGWPAAFRTAVDLCLASELPTVVLWGRELVQIYNDAFAALAGAKHPGALGAPARDWWPETWAQLEPLVTQVFDQGRAARADNLRLPIERAGFLEETFHTVAYTPIRLDDGGIGGVFGVFIETTGEVVAARRTRLLRDLAATTAETATVADVCRAASEVLGTSEDLRAALLYLADAPPARDTLTLAAASSLAVGGTVAPPALAAGDLSSWDVREVLRSGRAMIVDDVRARFGGVAVGPWGHPVERAVLLPLARPGQTALAGILIVLVTPQRPLDERFLDFLSLVSGHIVTAIENAQVLEEERARAESLTRHDRAKTAFFSNVSHEFRTPLTLMLGPLEDALASPSRALSGPTLETTYRNTLRLLKLVNALLDFTRVEGGRNEATFEPADLSALTVELAGMFRSAAERAGLRLVVDCASLPEPVYVDRDMWDKIVLNLLSNALKHTFEGELRVTLQPAGDEVQLTVEDTGIGIAPEELSRIFDRFHRVERARARTHEGSGIGLALVRDLARLHGGSIRAESEVGRGTRFIVSLPFGHDHLPQGRVARSGGVATGWTEARAYVAEAGSWLSTEPVHTSTPLSVGPRRRVVVADDNADLREYVSRLLVEACDIESVADGAAALAAIRRAPADLVIADVMMPSLDGLLLLRAIREDAHLRDTPVILLSARAGEETRLEGLQAGADDYLVKPFSARELVVRVSSQLALADERRRVASERERDRFRDLLSRVPAIVNVLRGPDLVFEFVHPIMAGMFAGREVLGRPLRDVVTGDNVAAIIEELQSVYFTGRPLSGSERLMRIDRAGTGAFEETYWNYLYQPVRSASGEVEGVMTFNLEVTEQVLARRRLEEQATELDRARRTSDEASRAKGEFLRTIEHRLREPLAPVRTALQVIGLTGGDTDETRLIGRQIGILTRLLDELLEVSHRGAATDPAPSEPPATHAIDEAERVEAHARQQRPEAASTGTRVLVVDDNEDGAETLRHLLEHLGYTVAVAHDGTGALHTVSSFAPDVAILDIGLPVMDGYELARHIREELGHRTPKLIALTGYGQRTDRERSRSAGFDHHLVKPLDFDALLRVLRSDAVLNGPA